MKLLVIRTVDLEVYPFEGERETHRLFGMSSVEHGFGRQTTSYDKDGTG